MTKANTANRQYTTFKGMDFRDYVFELDADSTEVPVHIEPRRTNKTARKKAARKTTEVLSVVADPVVLTEEEEFRAVFGNAEYEKYLQQVADEKLRKENELAELQKELDKIEKAARETEVAHKRQERLDDKLKTLQTFLSGKNNNGLSIAQIRNKIVKLGLHRQHKLLQERFGNEFYFEKIARAVKMDLVKPKAAKEAAPTIPPQAVEQPAEKAFQKQSATAEDEIIDLVDVIDELQEPDFHLSDSGYIDLLKPARGVTELTEEHFLQNIRTVLKEAELNVTEYHRKTGHDISTNDLALILGLQQMIKGRLKNMSRADNHDAGARKTFSLAMLNRIATWHTESTKEGNDPLLSPVAPLINVISGSIFQHENGRFTQKPQFTEAVTEESGNLETAYDIKGNLDRILGLEDAETRAGERAAAYADGQSAKEDLFSDIEYITRPATKTLEPVKKNRLSAFLKSTASRLALNARQFAAAFFRRPVVSAFALAALVIVTPAVTSLSPTPVKAPTVEDKQTVQPPVELEQIREVAPGFTLASLQSSAVNPQPTVKPAEVKDKKKQVKTAPRNRAEKRAAQKKNGGSKSLHASKQRAPGKYNALKDSKLSQKELDMGFRLAKNGKLTYNPDLDKSGYPIYDKAETAKIQSPQQSAVATTEKSPEQKQRIVEQQPRERDTLLTKVKRVPWPFSPYNY